MRKIVSALIALLVVLLVVSCSDSATGDVKISLVLPAGGIIAKGNQISVKTFYKEDPSADYEWVSSEIITAESKTGKEKFIRALKNNTVYKFYVEVVETVGGVQKIKYTGGIEGYVHDEDKNAELSLFLGVRGESSKVLATPNGKGVESYIGSNGSDGAMAVTLNNGKVLVAGGTDLKSYSISRKAYVFNPSKLSSSETSSLPVAIKNGAMAALDNKTDDGAAVLAFGETSSGYSSAVYLYDGSFRTIGSGTPVTGAKATTLKNGMVVISGGCNNDSASSDIYVVDNSGLLHSIPGVLKEGRCMHSMVDISPDTEENSQFAYVLVLGGATNVSPTSSNNFVASANFVEKITINLAAYGASSEIVSSGLTDVQLAGHASSVVSWPSTTGPEFAVITVGGFVPPETDSDTTLPSSSTTYVVSTTDGSSWVSATSAGFSCPGGSIATLSAGEKDSSRYAVANCGVTSIGSESPEDQRIYLLTASVKDTSVDVSNKPILDEGYSMMINGPIVTTSFGYAYAVGGRYFYLVPGFADTM